MGAEPGTLQRRLGEALFARVAGPEGPANRARFATPGPRWFAPTARSGGCTGTPRCSSAACARCCCSRCTRRR